MEKYTTTIEIPEENTKEDIEKKQRVNRTDSHRHKRKRRSGVFLYFLNAFLGFLIFSIICLVLLVMFFKFEHVEFENIKNANEKEIEEVMVSDIKLNNTIYVCLVNSFRDYSNVPFVEDVKISVKNRNTLLVKVKERETVGYFNGESYYIYFDSQGLVSEINPRPVLNIPIVSGFFFDGAKKGEPIPIEEGERKSLIAIIKNLKEYNIKADAIVFDEDKTFGFYFGDVFVDLGISSDLNEKCKRLQIILPQILGQSGTLHLEELQEENTDIIFEKSN